MLQLSKMHQAQMEQLTGCRYAVILHLAQELKQAQPPRGRPQQNGPLAPVMLALMKLRLNLSVRALEALTGIDSVTVARCVNRCLSFLGSSLLRRPAAGHLVVDTTSTRVAGGPDKAYSGYKHHRCSKAQVLVDTCGHVVSVSGTWPGSVHDKTIWNKESGNIAQLFEHLILADKAYVGAKGEGAGLLRPLKRSDLAYRRAPDKARQFNKELSCSRVKIEHVFAKLKTWRSLQGLFAWSWQRRDRSWLSSGRSLHKAGQPLRLTLYAKRGKRSNQPPGHRQPHAIACQAA